MTTVLEIAKWRIKDVIESLEEIPTGTNCLAAMQLEKAIEDIESVEKTLSSL